MMGGTGEPSVLAEPEPDLSEEDLRLLLEDDGAEDNETSAADAAARVLGDEEDDIGDDGASPSGEIQELRQELAKTQGALSALLRQQSPGGTPAPANDPVEAAHAAFFKNHADVPDETQDFFKEYGKTLVAAFAGAVAPRIQGIESTLRDRSSKDALDEFETRLSSVMEPTDLSDAEKELFKESVLMDGLRRYGNAFTPDQAVKIYRSKFKKVLDARGERRERDEQELDNENKTAPPPTRRGGNLSAREDVTGKLMDSTQRENTFGGKNWRKHISARMRELTRGGA